jgi:hypothetical protein
VHISPRSRSTLSSGVYTYTPNGTRSEPSRAGDRVTISVEARELHRAAELEHEAEAHLATFEGAELDDAHAAELALAYAYSLDREHIDRADEIAGTGPARYAATGTPVTRESERHFNTMAREIRSRRIALYEGEVQAGTPPVELLGKLVTFMNGQAPEYRAILDWDRLIGHLPERNRSGFARTAEGEGEQG